LLNISEEQHTWYLYYCP